LFNRRILRQFSALTNVQELGIEYLDIPKFMPGIRRYFGHFSPTVRSLVLREPKGSRRQILYFVGLFQHLEDLGLVYDQLDFQEESVDDLRLIPPSVPPLQGRLTLRHFARVELLKDMIDLFGGVRFHHMDLCDVYGMRLLLDACAKTLETLRVYPIDPRCENFSGRPTSSGPTLFADRTFRQDFDLSRNKSLRTVEILAASIRGGHIGFFKHVLPTITSCAPLKVIIIYRDCDFCSSNPEGRFWSWRFREVYKIRNFQLELCADVQGGAGESAVQTLRLLCIAAEKKGGFRDTFPKPLVFYSSRRPHREYWSEMYATNYCFPL